MALATLTFLMGRVGRVIPITFDPGMPQGYLVSGLDYDYIRINKVVLAGLTGSQLGKRPVWASR